MATHRKKSAKKRVRTSELAVAAFLGLVVTAAPAVAVADTSGSPSDGNSSDSGSGTSNDSGNGTGGVNAGPRAGGDAGTTTSSPVDDDDDDDEDDSGLGDNTLGGGGLDADPDEEDVDDDDLETDLETDLDEDSGLGEDGGNDADGDLNGEEPAGNGTDPADEPTDLGEDTGDGEVAGGTGPETVDPPVPAAPVDPEATDPEAGTVAPPADPAPVTIEVPEPDVSSSSLVAGNDPAPTPSALASALIDVEDIVSPPPAIPAFDPFMGAVKAIATWLDQVLPAYEPNAILNPTQVAAGFVMTLQAVMQGTYWNGQPTLFTFGAYVLLSAAYQRYERLATNHLPGTPTLEGGLLPFSWKLTSVDPDGDLLLYSVSDQPSNGLITMLPDGSFTFAPYSLDDLNNGADVEFTVRVNDSLGFLEHPLTPEGNDAFFTVNFRYPGLGINNLPVFEDDGKAQVVGTDGSTGRVTITAQATDEDDDVLTYTALAAFGTVVRNEDGTFTYTPNDIARHLAGTLLGAKTDIVSIWANDGRGGITLLPTTVTVDIVSSNGAPTVTVNPDTFTDPILGSITGSLDIDDPDGDLPIVLPTGLSTRGGLVTVLGNVYTYTPSLSIRSQGGTDTFTLSVDDLHGGVTEVTVTVTVAQINVAPVFQTTPTITHTDHTTGVLTGTFQVSDANGDNLTFTSAGLLGTIAVDPTPAADGVTYTFTYTPYNPHAASLPLAITTDLVTITAWDGGLLSGDSATFTVQLSTQVNQTPSGSYQNTDSNSILGTVSGKIIVDDDDVLHGYTPLIMTTDKGSILVNGLTGHYTYTASIEARNAASASNATAADKIDTFTITVTDPAGKSVDVQVTVDIPQWNLAPAGGVPSNVVPDSNGVVRGRITGVINLDNDPLTYYIAGSNGAGAVYTEGGGIAHVDAEGNYVYIPRTGGALGYYDSFSVTVDDGRGGLTTVLVVPNGILPATPLNDVDVSTTNGAPGVVTGGVSLGSSANTGLFSSFSATGAGHGTVTFNGANYTYTRTATGHVGGTSDTFDIVGTAFGLTITVATVTVTPVIVNTPPAAGTTTITESDLVNLGLIRTQTTKGKVTAFDADGDAIDYPGGSIIPATYSTANGGSVQFYSDGTFSYSITKGHSYFHDAAVTGATGHQVNDTFSITVTDSFGASSTIVVSVPIEKLNATPSGSVSVGGKATDALGVVRGTVSGSDGDDDSLTYSLVGGTNGTAATANGGIVRFSGNSFTYIPSAGKATDSFQVTVNDGHGGVSTATISLTGLSTPSPTTNVSTSTVNVVTGQLNTAGNTGLTYSVGGQGTKGTVTVTSTGAFTYTRNGALGHSQTPGDTFTIRATDANGNSVIIATVNVTPTVANAAPVAGSTVFNPSTIEDKRILGIGDWKQTTTGTLKATDADGDNVTFTAGSFSTGNGGTVVINTNGTFSYTVEKGYSYFHGAAKIGATGTAVADTFTATAVDGFGGVTNYSVSVAIYAMNKAPTISGGVKIINVTSINVDDDDGDDLTFNHNGDNFVFGGRGLATSSLWGGNRLTVTDGYYVTVNGVVTGTPASVTKTW